MIVVFSMTDYGTALVYNLFYGFYTIYIASDIIFLGYTLIPENPIFLRGLRGFAGVVLRYKDPQGPQHPQPLITMTVSGGQDTNEIRNRIVRETGMVPAFYDEGTHIAISSLSGSEEGSAGYPQIQASDY